MKAIESGGVHYRELNQTVRGILDTGEERIFLQGVNGQRYIGVGLAGKARIDIEGTAGNNLGAMMNGLTVCVNGNAQDGLGNTMKSGRIIVRGMAGDIVGYGMLGGKILIKDNVGWRVGIHMKGKRRDFPVIIIGGKAGDFLGEYMAGGTIVVLGLNGDGVDHDGRNPFAGKYIASGMHGGKMYIRGVVPEWQVSEQAHIELTTPEKCEELQEYIDEFSVEFGLDCSGLREAAFSRLTPKGVRPYAHLYNHR